MPVVVREMGDAEALEIAIIENVQRADLNAIEEAAAYHELMDRFKYTQERIAKEVGKSRSHVANTLRLLTPAGSGAGDGARRPADGRPCPHPARTSPTPRRARARSSRARSTFARPNSVRKAKREPAVDKSRKTSNIKDARS